MVHYNDIKEGQTVKYFGYDCKVESKAQNEDGYYLTLEQPNMLMMTIKHNVYSKDGYFKNISI